MTYLVVVTSYVVEVVLEETASSEKVERDHSSGSCSAEQTDAVVEGVSPGSAWVVD